MSSKFAQNLLKICSKFCSKFAQIFAQNFALNLSWILNFIMFKNINFWARRASRTAKSIKNPYFGARRASRAAKPSKTLVCPLKTHHLEGVKQLILGALRAANSPWKHIILRASDSFWKTSFWGRFAQQTAPENTSFWGRQIASERHHFGGASPANSPWKLII